MEEAVRAEEFEAIHGSSFRSENMIWKMAYTPEGTFLLLNHTSVMVEVDLGKEVSRWRAPQYEAENLQEMLTYVVALRDGRAAVALHRSERIAMLNRSQEKQGEWQVQFFVDIKSHITCLATDRSTIAIATRCTSDSELPKSNCRLLFRSTEDGGESQASLLVPGLRSVALLSDNILAGINDGETTVFQLLTASGTVLWSKKYDELSSLSVALHPSRPIWYALSSDLHHVIAFKVSDGERLAIVLEQAETTPGAIMHLSISSGRESRCGVMFAGSSFDAFFV